MTTVGNAVVVTVDHCPEFGCFPYEVPYSPDDFLQIRRLIERSSDCTQELKIKCQTAPLEVSFRLGKIWQLLDSTYRI